MNIVNEYFVNEYFSIMGTVETVELLWLIVLPIQSMETGVEMLFLLQVTENLKHTGLNTKKYNITLIACTEVREDSGLVDSHAQ